MWIEGRSRSVEGRIRENSIRNKEEGRLLDGFAGDLIRAGLGEDKVVLGCGSDESGSLEGEEDDCEVRLRDGGFRKSRFWKMAEVCLVFYKNSKGVSVSMEELDEVDFWDEVED